jgi:hypothetical protein
MLVLCACLMMGQAPVFGMNTYSNAPYSTEQAWVDVAKLFRKWGPYDKSNAKGVSIPVTSNNYPLVNAATRTFMSGYPGGVYKLRFRGRARITFEGPRFRGMGPVVRGSDGISRADVMIKEGHGLLHMLVSDVDPKDPLRDLHLIRPGYDPEHPPTFTKEFLRRMRPFKTIRSMGWLEIIPSTIREWSDRPKPDDFYEPGRGVPLETMIELCNTIGADLWLNTPGMANDEYIHQMARMVRDQLAPDRLVYLERSNEVWNSAYKEYHHTFEEAKKHPDRYAARQGFLLIAQRHADESARIAGIFRKEFGSQAGRLRPVLAGQSVNPVFLATGLDYLASRGIKPSEVFYAIAIATYLKMSPEDDLPGISMDQLFAAIEADYRRRIEPGVHKHAALAKQYGLRLVAYEGGQGLEAMNRKLKKKVNQELKLRAQFDPRMAHVYEIMTQGWLNAGGGLFILSGECGPYSDFGYWPLLDDQNAPGSVKWDAVLRMMLPPGDANLDNRVDFADFLTFRKFFGRPKPLWWEQGDFNGDNLVGPSDLSAFWAHAQLSAEERAQVQAFAQVVKVKLTTPAGSAGPRPRAARTEPVRPAPARPKARHKPISASDRGPSAPTESTGTTP